MSISINSAVSGNAADSINGESSNIYGGVIIDAGGRKRVSQITTLFDGKALTVDDTNVWETVGTGTVTHPNNTSKLAVTAGQYLIRRSRCYIPYFSGKSQLVEGTFDNFQSTAGIVKRFGYFSSNAVAPYDSNKDGFWIENDGTTILFIVQKDGVVIISTPLSEFSNYSAIATYDWSKFTVIVFDFLWLGGTNVRLIISINGVLNLVNTFKYSGNFTGTFIKSPNQNIRYEIRSTSGTEYLTAICSQVASEGSFDESGKLIGIYNLSGISCSTIGTIYALKGIRKNPTYRDTPIELLDVGAIRNSANDAGMLMMILNPTLSSPLTWANNSRFSEGTATTQTITAGTGRILQVIPTSQGTTHSLEKNFLSFLSISIADVPDEYILAYMPTTTNQTIYGTINGKEY